MTKNKKRIVGAICAGISKYKSPGLRIVPDSVGTGIGLNQFNIMEDQL